MIPFPTYTNLSCQWLVQPQLCQHHHSSLSCGLLQCLLLALVSFIVYTDNTATPLLCWWHTDNIRMPAVLYHRCLWLMWVTTTAAQCCKNTTLVVWFIIITALSVAVQQNWSSATSGVSPEPWSFLPTASWACRPVWPRWRRPASSSWHVRVRSVDCSVVMSPLTSWQCSCSHDSTMATLCHQSAILDHHTAVAYQHCCAADVRPLTCRDHVTDASMELCWLPVCIQIQYRLCPVVHWVLNVQSLNYIAKLLHRISTMHSGLWSADTARWYEQQWILACWHSLLLLLQCETAFLWTSKQSLAPEL